MILDEGLTTVRVAFAHVLTGAHVRAGNPEFVLPHLGLIKSSRNNCFFQRFSAVAGASGIDKRFRLYTEFAVLPHASSANTVSAYVVVNKLHRWLVLNATLAYLHQRRNEWERSDNGIVANKLTSHS